MSHPEVRRISKLLLGSRYRLEVAAAIAGADPGVVHVREVAADLGLTDNLVRLEFQHFEEAGVLLRLERPQGQQRQYFERMPSAYWELVRVLAEDAERSERAL
jgi:predicted transcriptional regulator